MTVQSDKWIKKMVKDHAMILPFEEKQVRNNKISLNYKMFLILITCDSLSGSFFIKNKLKLVIIFSV